MRKPAKLTQKDRVLAYIRTHGSVTRMESAYYIGCFELAARINELEKAGYKFNKKRIKVKTKYGDTISVTKYSLR